MQHYKEQLLDPAPDTMATLSLLHIDDDKLIGRIVNIVLSKNNHWQLHHATNGKDALDWLSCNQPDVILIDMMMPGVDGCQVYQTMIEEKLITKKTAVIFVSAGITSQMFEKVLSLGAAGVIHKPFDVRTLERQILSISDAFRQSTMEPLTD